MKTASHRALAVTVFCLMLAGAVAWWWSKASNPEQSVGSALSDALSEEPARDTEGQPANARRVTQLKPAEAAERCGKAMMAALRDHAASLKQRQDGRSQLGYALVAPVSVYWEIARAGPQRDDPTDFKRLFEAQQVEAQQAFARARTLAPDDPDILWLAANQCGADEGCRGVQQEVLRVEADNAAVWLQEMTWARVRGDKAAVEHAFERAARASGYDRHTGASHLAILESFAAVPMPNGCAASGVQAELQRNFPGPGEVGAADFILMMSSAASGIQMPAYIDISRHCKPDPAVSLDAKRRAACGRILEKLAGGDTLMEQSIALRLLVQLAGDGPDASRWRERYRNHRWMMSQAMTPALQTLTLEDYALSEVHSMQEALLAAGRWPAPTNWLPRDRHARSLIQTGRPPPDPPR